MFVRVIDEEMEVMSIVYPGFFVKGKETLLMMINQFGNRFFVIKPNAVAERKIRNMKESVVVSNIVVKIQKLSPVKNNLVVLS